MRSPAVKILALANLALLAAAAFAQRTDAGNQSEPLVVDPVPVANYLIFRNQAFIVGDPILVSGPLVTQAVWSPNGQFALVERWSRPTNVLDIQTATREKQPEKPVHYLSLYSLARGQISDVARYSEESGFSPEITWIADSNIALISTRKVTADANGKPQIEAGLIRLDAATGSYSDFHPWNTAGPPDSVEVIPSPSKPYVFLNANFGGKPELVMASAEGRFGSVALSPEAKMVLAGWSKSGDTGYVREIARGAPKSWSSVRPENLERRPVQSTPDLWTGEQPVGLITVRDVPGVTVNGKFSSGLRSLWLETLDPDSQSRVLLAGDAEQGQVNSSLDAASYLSQGSLFIRPITPVPKSRYDAAVVSYRRTQALRQVREAGLAAIMFAADNDDVYPGAKDNISDLLSPYLRNASTMNGFVYTYPGGPASGIQSPATTELGYISFDDGRAVVYADGHARWVPRSK